MTIGDELRRYRELSFLTQRKLGELLGFPSKYADQIIRHWELNKQPVPLKHFRRLHDITGIPYEKLIP